MKSAFKHTAVLLVLFVFVTLFSACTQGDGNAPASGAEISKPVETSEPGESSGYDETSEPKLELYSLRDYFYTTNTYAGKTASHVIEGAISRFHKEYEKTEFCIFKEQADSGTELPEKLCLLTNYHSYDYSSLKWWDYFEAICEDVKDFGWYKRTPSVETTTAYANALSLGEDLESLKKGGGPCFIDSEVYEEGPGETYIERVKIGIGMNSSSMLAFYWPYPELAPVFSELCGMQSGAEPTEENLAKARIAFMKKYFPDHPASGDDVTLENALFIKKSRIDPDNIDLTYISNPAVFEGALFVKKYQLDPDNPDWTYCRSLAAIEIVTDETELARKGSSEKAMFKSVSLFYPEVPELSEAQTVLTPEEAWERMMRDSSCAVFDENAPVYSELTPENVIVLDWALSYTEDNASGCYKPIYVFYCKAIKAEWNRMFHITIDAV